MDEVGVRLPVGPPNQNYPFVGDFDLGLGGRKPERDGARRGRGFCQQAKTCDRLPVGPPKSRPPQGGLDFGRMPVILITGATKYLSTPQSILIFVGCR